MTNSLDVLLGLNSSQYSAVTSNNQHVLVLAGAGTGKTKTIISRSVYLIKKNVSPKKIQILTFTKRAAQEIKSRIREEAGLDSVNVNASTFHSWCVYLLRRSPLIFNNDKYTIIDRDDQLYLFKLARGKRKRFEAPFAAVLCNIYSLCRNKDKFLSEVLLNVAPEFKNCQKEIENIFIAYENIKEKRSYIDYDDIIHHVANQMSTSLEFRSWVSSRVEHLLIDEMQDTNPLQWRLIEPLLSSTNIFCVGDDAQSIYGFRGADFKNIHLFSNKVKGARVYKLTENYRSTQEILNISNCLLSQSKLNYDKKLLAKRTGGELPILVSFNNRVEEAEWVAGDIVKNHNLGTSYNSQMILVRSSMNARLVEASLLTHNIPYRFIGGSKLLESAHIKDVLAPIKISINPSDELSWTRFLSIWQGIGEVTASHLVNEILIASDINQILDILNSHDKVPKEAIDIYKNIASYKGDAGILILNVLSSLEKQLKLNYGEKEQGEIVNIS